MLIEGGLRGRLPGGTVARCELDADRVLILGHFVARGRTSGLDVQQVRTEGTNVFHLRGGGKVTRLVLYFAIYGGSGSAA